MPYQTQRTCRQHPDLTADFLCDRCGDFICEDCLRKIQGMHKNYCAECFQKRARHIKELKLNKKSNKAAEYALIFGLLSLIPMCIPALLIGLVCGIGGLFVAEKRGVGLISSAVGLALSSVGLLLYLAIMIF